MATSVNNPISTIPRRSRIRALVADSDGQRRGDVLNAVFHSGFYEVLGEVTTMQACREFVRAELPELVVCSDSVLPPDVIGEQLFPLFVVVGGGSGTTTSESVFGFIADPNDGKQVQDVLAGAASRILTMKAGELSNLIRNYLLHNEEMSGRAQSITVDHLGKPLLLRTSQIHWIKASGNYVSLHTDSGVYGLRESIRRTYAQLQGAGFVRIHRGAIVNQSAIRRCVVENGETIAVELSDGTALRVGPNFRNDVRGFHPGYSSFAS
jgi:hypothetical protein